MPVFAGKGASRPAVRVTHNGYLFMTLLAAMLLAASNYGNSMAYIMCFIILGQTVIVVIDMRQYSHGFAIDEIETAAVFAGEWLDITVLARNHTKKTKYALAIAVDGRRRLWSAPFSLVPQNGSRINLALPTSRRGRFRLPSLCISSSYPVGFFRVWAKLPYVHEYVVYPSPAGELPWPALVQRDSIDTASQQASGGDDFAGLRPYQPGMSPRHIDWKAYARGRPLMVKEFCAGGSQEQWFGWQDLPGLETEARIAQLTRWVLAADEQNIPFGLQLPDRTIAADCGSHHTRACLTALAVYQPWP